MPDRQVVAADEGVHPGAAPGRCARAKGHRPADGDGAEHTEDEDSHAETAGGTREWHGCDRPRSRSPQRAELAEITRAGSGLAAQMTVGAVVALGHVAGGGGPERRDAGKGAAEIRRRRIDKVAAAVAVVPGIVGRPAWRAHQATAQVFPLPA